MAENNPGLFRRLTQLFRSGPTIKRRVKAWDGKNPQTRSSLQQFRKAHSDVYTSTMSAYGSFDRMSRYSDFSEMENTPEIASALDIYAEETSSVDEKGQVLHIYSENRKVRELLNTLFYDTLNVGFNLPMWVRNLCKYGDFFLFNDVSPEFGIIGAYPIPISEIEREEGYDPEDPTAVRFRWMTQGNQILENWQISHFRLLGNDAFLPYGSSVLESARRIWRQLILIEDAMLVYRVIRSPERRVFYIDVGNVPPENVAEYLEQAKTSLKRDPVLDRDDGRVDLRYNPLSVDEDYFIPVRGGESGTKIESLAGGQNTSAIEDVEYIQKKLFAALKIPKAYLGYDESVGAKATLAQEDIRFSRSIQRIQKTVIAELNKIAMIHLYAHGFTSEDLVDFELKLSNPSSIAVQQKLELISTRFDIAGKVPEGMLDKRWVRKNVLGLTDEDIKQVEEGMIQDAVNATELESAGAEAGGGGGGGEEGGGDEGGGLFAVDTPSGDTLDGKPIQPAAASSFHETDKVDEDEDEDLIKLSLTDEDGPARVEDMIRNVWNEPIKKRRHKRGSSVTHMPDLASMTSAGSKTRPRDTLNEPYDQSFFRNPFGEGLADQIDEEVFSNDITVRPKLNLSMVNTLNKLSNVINIPKSSVLTEDVAEGELDIELFDSTNMDEN